MLQLSFDKLLDLVFSRFNVTTRGYVLSIKDEVLRITGYIPRELVNLAETIGTTSLTLDEVKSTLREYEANRIKEFFNKAKTHYDSLQKTSQEDTRLALADMFLPGKTRVTGRFDWRFLDFGIVYQYKVDAMVLYNPICPAAKEALLNLYKHCPLLEAYSNAFIQDKLDSIQFEDFLLQQLICYPDIILQTTNLDGKHSLKMHFCFKSFELLRQPPKYYGKAGKNILIRCHKGYPRFDFILGYVFIQVSINSFIDYNNDTAKIENAFELIYAEKKNQIEYHLNNMFGGTHSAKIVECDLPVKTVKSRAIKNKTAKNKTVDNKTINNKTIDNKKVKKFIVKKDGKLYNDFKIVYICSSLDPKGPSYSVKVKKFPEL